MLLSEDLLNTLERNHQNRLSAKDKTALNASLNKDSLLAEEAKVFNEIWNGFDALKGHQQVQLFQQWEQDWLEHDESELIEWYLNDELGKEATKRLDDKCKNDTRFSLKVKALKNIQGGFDSLKSDNFRKKMGAWQTPTLEQKKPTGLSISWKRPLAIAASILLLIATSFSWWSHEQVSNPSLVANHYLAPAIGNNLSGETAIGEYLNTYAQAHLFMKAESYPEAIEAFQLLKNQELPQEWPESERKHYSENVEWNLLLALLGDEQLIGDFDLNLERIANDTEHEYQNNAINLKNKLASFWRF